MIERLIGPEPAEFIFKHQDMYPAAMREPREVFERLIKGGLCWGDQVYSLRGWALCEHIIDKPKTAYWYDMAVLRQYQGEGIMKKLAAHVYRELRWLGYSIEMHCRKASMPSPSFLWRHGYEIALDKLIENHYEEEYGDPSLHGEHAHELLLVPTGQVEIE